MLMESSNLELTHYVKSLGLLANSANFFLSDRKFGEESKNLKIVNESQNENCKYNKIMIWNTSLDILYDQNNKSAKDKLELICFFKKVTILYCTTTFTLTQFVNYLRDLSKLIKEKKITKLRKNACFLDQNQNPILNFTGTSGENQNINDVFCEFCQIFLEKISKIDLIDEKYGLINKDGFKIKDEINKLYSGIQEKQTINELIEYFDEFLKGINGSPEKPFVVFLENCYYNKTEDPNINTLINELLNTSRKQLVFNYDNFLTIVKSIFDCYKNFLGTENCLDIFLDEFTDFLIDNDLINEPNSTDMESLAFSMIQSVVEQNKFFTLDFAFRIIIEMLINRELLKEKVNKIFTAVTENNQIFEEDCGPFTNTSYAAKLIVDKFLNFKIQYNFFEATNNKKCIEYEIKILEDKISKFIVHCSYKDRLDRIYIPYYPLGTITSILEQTKMSIFSLVDRFVLILEIAQAFVDLHSHGYYHGNFCDECVFLDSYKNGYVGYFSHDINKTNTKSKSQLVFHPKEVIESIGKNELSKDAYKLVDVYSFGVLIYEIITGISPMSIFVEKNLSTEKRNDILKGDYCKFLFDYVKDGLKIGDCIDNYMDYKGSTSKGIKMIIENCIKTDPKQRFQSMEIVLQFLKNLPIYEQNYEEIEFRLNSAIDSRKYRCSFHDVIISYYLGNKKDNLTYLLNITDTNITNYKPNNDIIFYILQKLKMRNPVYHRINESRSSTIQYLLKLSKKKNHPQNKCNIFKIRGKIQSYFNLFQNYQSVFPSQSQFYLDFINLIKDNKFVEIELSESKTLESVKDDFYNIIEEIQSKDIYFLFDHFIKIIVTKFIETKDIYTKIEDKVIFDDDNTLNSENESENKLKYADIGETIGFAEQAYAARVHIGSDFCFYLCLHYNDSTDLLQVNHEKKIFYRNDMKFVVHSSDIQKTQLYIPYFSYGTVNNLISSKNSNDDKELLLTIADKFTIIMEVLQSVNDLHQNGEYHGNLWGQSVFLSSSKDAYLGYFSYDRKPEANGSKSKGPIYYRAPEVAEKPDESHEAPDYEKKQQLNDIYSLGVLMHEIFTETIPEKRFGNMARNERMKLVKGKEYCDFLFSGENNEIFNDKDSGEKLKYIIHKCMSYEPENRYQKIEGIVNEIKETSLYKQNQEEIEYRIKMAPSSSEYKCTLSDVIVSFIRGQNRAKTIIQKLIDKCVNQSDQNSQSKQFTISNDEEIIRSIFKGFDMENDNYIYYTVNFKKILDNIIYKNASAQIDKDFQFDNDDEMIKKSLKANTKAYSDSGFIINGDEVIPPVSSLENFDYNNQPSNNRLFFVFSMAKELMYIHSKNMFHGGLSLNSIGVYFNNKSKSFIPLIIPYYYFYKGCKNSSRSMQNIMYNIQINELQKSDVKKFIKIAQKLNIDENILDEINEYDSMAPIVYVLYQHVIKLHDQFISDNLKYFDYKYFIISYYDFDNILEKAEEQKITSLSIDIESLFEDFINVLSKISTNINQPVLYTAQPKLKAIKETKKINFDMISILQNELLVQATKLYKFILENYVLDRSNVTIVEENNIMTIIFSPGIPTKKTIYKPIKFTNIQRPREKQERNWYYKNVQRRFDLGELRPCMGYFYMRRYLMNLNPRLNFKITVKILNKTYSPYQEKPIKSDKLIEVSKNCGFLDAENKDGNIIITIKNSRKPKNDNE